jgi:hypothetical protein
MSQNPPSQDPLQPIQYGSTFGIFSMEYGARLDIGPGFVKPRSPGSGTWGARLKIQRLDGPSEGPVYMNHVVGIFASNPGLPAGSNPAGNVRLDIGLACVQKQQNISTATETSQLTIQPWDSVGRTEVHYGDVVHILSYDFGDGPQYELDIGTAQMKIDQSASHVSWATQLFLGPDVLPINQEMLNNFKALNPTDPDVAALTLRTILQNTNGLNINWGNIPTVPESEAAKKRMLEDVTACDMARGYVVFDVFCLIFGAVGLRKAVNQYTIRAVAAAAAPVLNQLEIWIRSITAPGASVFTQAMGVFNIAKTIYNGGCFGAVFKAFVDSLTWYQAALLGIQGIATVVAAFATDGLALAAQISLMLVSFTFLVLDCKTMVDTCYGNKSSKK